jgi:hypothetical protein
MYWTLASIGLLVFVIIYRSFDPSVHPFPPCPVYKFIGIRCPGCGSQRALHQLLNGDLKSAFGYNQLLVLSIPYLTLGWLTEYTFVGKRYPFLRKKMFGIHAAAVAFVTVIVFTLLRNLYGF